MLDFHKILSNPVADSDNAIQMDSPLSFKKVPNSIKSIQSKKVPAQTGLRLCFTKKFIEKLPQLLFLFNSSPSKKDTYPLQCGSYRLLSLLNTDVKVLGIVVGSRLENVLASTISEQQNSLFLIPPNFNFFSFKDLVKLPEIMSLDAEKAFDRVEWEHLFDVLKKFGFGDKFPGFTFFTNLSLHIPQYTNGTHS